MLRRAAGLIAGGALLLGAGTAEVAGAAPVWQPVQQLGTPAYAPYGPLEACTAVVVAPGGKATALWIGDAGLTVSVRRQGRFWSAPVVVAPASGKGCQAEVDADGVITAIWQQTDGAVMSVHGADALAWGAPETVLSAITPSTGEYSRTALTLTVDTAGATLTSVAPAPDAVRAYTVVERRAGGWGTPVRLSAAGRFVGLATAAANARGDAIAVWKEDATDGAPSAWRSAVRSSGGAWVSGGDPGLTADGVQAAVGPDGTATLLWRRGRYASESEIGLVERFPAGSWSSGPVEGAAPVAVGGDLVYDGAGRLTVAWADYAGVSDDGVASFDSYAATRSADGSWEAQHRFTYPGVDLEADAGGDVVAVATTGTGRMAIVSVVLALRPAGGAWGEEQRFQGGSEFDRPGPTAAVGPGATGALLWTLQGRIVASGIDRADTPPDTTPPVVRSAAFAPYVFTTAAGSTLAVRVSEPARIDVQLAAYDPRYGFTNSTADGRGLEPLAVTARRGSNALALPLLVPSAYRATITATDAAGNISEPVVTYAYVPACGDETEPPGCGR